MIHGFYSKVLNAELPQTLVGMVIDENNGQVTARDRATGFIPMASQP